MFNCLQSLFTLILQLVQDYRCWQNENLIFHKALNEKSWDVRTGGKRREHMEPLTKPFLKQLPNQERSNLTVNVW